MKRAYLIVILLLLSQPIFAQSSLPNKSKPAQPAPTPPTPASSEDDVIKIDVNLVQVDAVVTDKRGHQVTNLKAEDFSIVEKGIKHVAEYCAYVPLDTFELTSNLGGPPTTAQLGRTFVFLVDNPRIEFANSFAGISSGPSTSFVLLQRAMRGAINAEKLLSWFVEKEMNSRDLVAIADTEVNLGVLSSFTNDRAVLREAIQQIRANPLSSRAHIVRVTLSSAGLDLRDLAKQNLRVLETLSNVIKQLETLPGRKILTLLSRGMLFDPRWPGADAVIQRMEKVIEQANRSKVSIYALSPSGVGNFGGDPLQNLDSLIHMAKETGGRAIFNTNDTRVGFAQIVEKTRGYYLLAYKSDPETNARPHSLKVRLNRDDLQIEARSTAYTARGSSSDTQASLDSLKAAINSPLQETTIPLKVMTSFTQDETNNRQILFEINVPLTEADLAAENDSAAGEFEIALRVTGPDGDLKPPTIHKLTFTASGDERNRALKEGITTRLKFPAATAGFYRISIAVRNKRSGEVGSTSSFIKTLQ